MDVAGYLQLSPVALVSEVVAADWVATLPCFASGAGCFDDSLPDWDGAPVMSKQLSAHTIPTYSAGACCWSAAMPCSASAF